MARTIKVRQHTRELEGGDTKVSEHTRKIKSKMASNGSDKPLFNETNNEIIPKQEIPEQKNEMYKDKKKLAHIKISRINWDEPIVEELKERATLQDFEFDQKFSEFEQTEEYEDFLNSYYNAKTYGNGGYYVIFFDGEDFKTSIFSSNTHISPDFQEQIVWQDNWYGDTGIEYWIDEWDKTGETDEEGTPEWENEEGKTIFVSEDSNIWGDKDNINIFPENPNLPNQELLDFLLDESYITIYEDGSYCIYTPHMDAAKKVYGTYTCNSFDTYSCGGKGEYEWDEEEFKKLGAEIEYDRS